MIIAKKTNHHFQQTSFLLEHSEKAKGSLPLAFSIPLCKVAYASGWYCLFLFFQPFAYVVANHTCQYRNQKTYHHFHGKTPPFRWRFGSIFIIV